MEDKIRNPLTKIIDPIVRKSGSNENYIAAVLHHLNVAKEHLYKKEHEFKYRQDLIDVLLSKLFLDKPDIFPPERYTGQVDESFDWPIPLYPAEAFGKEKYFDIRIKDFFECLKVGHVLDCKVTFALPAEYHLRVIHKPGSIRLLEDLNILVTLSRIKSEGNARQNDLSLYELIRVGVSHIEKKEVKVTLDESTLPITKSVKLGKLPETDLPQYVLNPTAFADCATLTDFLNAHQPFKNPLLLNSVLKSYGHDVKRMCSYYPNLDGLKCSDGLTGQAILEETKKSTLKAHLNAAVEAFQEGNVTQPLDAVRLALEIDNKCSKAYEIRGSLYAKISTKKICSKALWDFAKLHTLDDENSIARKYLSKALCAAAIKFFFNKNYEKAFIASEKALHLDKDNATASLVLNRLKKKHPECCKMQEESEKTPENKEEILSSKMNKISIKAEPVD